MPLTREFLDGLEAFKAIENADEIKEKILTEHESDLTGLKRNNKDLLDEKKKLADEKKAVIDEKKALEDSVKDLDEKLKAGLPEEQRKHYEVELQNAKNSINAITAESEKKISEREAKIAELEAQHHEYVVHSEFNDLVNADPSIFPEMKSILKSAFFSENKFKYVDMPDGKKLLNDASKTMKDALTEFLGTPGGLRFRESKNNGGGAPGSGGAKPGQNTVTREQLRGMSDVQKTEFFAKGGKIAT